MKLFELSGIKGQKEKDMLQLLKDISGDESKFKKTGEGAAAQVFVHEDGTIYKFWAKDSAYEKFIEFVEKNQGDKHLPKLKSKIKEFHAFFKKPDDFPDKIKYIKMEKLKPITYDTIMPGTKELFIVDVVQETATSALNNRRFKKLIDQFTGDEEGDLNEEVVQIISELYDTFTKMYKYPGIKMMNYDLHSGNIMLRGSTIVIIDPVIDSKELAFNKQLMRQIKQLHRDSNEIK